MMRKLLSIFMLPILSANICFANNSYTNEELELREKYKKELIAKINDACINENVPKTPEKLADETYKQLLILLDTVMKERPKYTSSVYFDEIDDLMIKSQPYAIFFCTNDPEDIEQEYLIRERIVTESFLLAKTVIENV